jgi:hypothetical protein
MHLHENVWLKHVEGILSLKCKTLLYIYTHLFVSLPYLRNILSSFSVSYLYFLLCVKLIVLFWLRFLINLK